MKKWLTTLVMTAAVALPMQAVAGGPGYYWWTLSFSDTDPNVQVGNEGVGITNIHLWYVEGCNSVPTEGAGMSAAEFGAKAKDGWTIIAFNTANGFLNAGTPTDLLLAVGGCPTATTRAGTFLVTGTGGKMGLANTTNPAGVVDCAASPALWPWPTNVRFTGCKSTTNAGASQDHGASCGGIVSVESTSWGSIKSLYR